MPAEGPEIATPFLASRPLDVLNYFKIGLVALYNRPGGPNSPPMNPDDKAAYMSLLSRISSAPPVYAGDDETIYKADRTDLSQATPSFHLGGDWYPLEKSNGAPFRWVKGGSGTLCIFAPRAARAALVMDGTAFGQDRTVEISSDDKTLLSELVPSGGRFATLRTEPIDWPEGVTELRIAANGPGITPESLDPNTGDKRNLSVGFKGVHLESIAQK